MSDEPIRFNMECAILEKRIDYLERILVAVAEFQPRRYPGDILQPFIDAYYETYNKRHGFAFGKSDEAQSPD
jgi:hypothetical protein